MVVLNHVRFYIVNGVEKIHQKNKCFPSFLPYFFTLAMFYALICQFSNCHRANSLTNSLQRICVLLISYMGWDSYYTVGLML